MDNVKLMAGRGVADTASARAAERAYNEGGSPREQIDAARVAAGTTRIGYLPHQGLRERARRIAQMERAEAKRAAREGRTTP